MWDVPPEKTNLSLPEGFHLKEDEDFVYLLYRETRVAVFSSTRVDPKEIEREVKNYIACLALSRGPE